MDRRLQRGAGQGFTIRAAREDDLPEVRAFMLQVFTEDFGYGYNPDYHADVDDLAGAYLQNERHTLLVAVNDATGEVVGTGGVRSGGLKPEFNPGWLVQRYDPERTAQLVRVYTARHCRGKGIARAIVDHLLRFVAREGGFDVVALHADPRSPGAERFWTSLAATLILDDREGPSGSLHFEMPIPHVGGLAPGTIDGGENDEE